MDIASYRVGPYPRWLYHASEGPRVVNTPSEEKTCFDAGFSREYQHQEYPKMMFSPDGEMKSVANAEEEAALAGEGWTDTPPVIPDVAPVTLDPTGASFPAAGGDGSFTVTMTGPGISNTWTVDKQSEATWLTITAPPEDTPQSADGTVNYTVTENTNSARTGAFYVNGKTFTVDQEGIVAARSKKH